MGFPVVGLTTYQAKNDQHLPITGLLRAYQEAILQAGGVPVLLPAFLPEEALRVAVRRLDGLVFTGGGDIERTRFEGIDHTSISGVDVERDTTEFALLDAILDDGKPFLGICRGFQVLNVHFGGSLYTHLQDQREGSLKHDYYPDWPRNHRAHEVNIMEGARLGQILEVADLAVNSLHHQGVREIGMPLMPSAYAPDGLVEGLELPGHPFGLAVQWHPEWLLDQAPTQRLFRAFIEACR